MRIAVFSPQTEKIINILQKNPTSDSEKPNSVIRKAEKYIMIYRGLIQIYQVGLTFKISIKIVHYLNGIMRIIQLFH
jgi:hypothetical protein